MSTTIPTTIPHGLLSGEGHRNPSTTSKLHHTWGTTMNREEKPWRWENRKEERSPNRFLERNGEDRRRLALVSLLFSSLLFSSLLFSSSPSPLSFLDLVTAKGGAGRGNGLGFTNGMYSMRSMQPQCPFVHSSNGSKKVNFSHQLCVFPCRKRILPFLHLECYIRSLTGFGLTVSMFPILFYAVLIVPF